MAFIETIPPEQASGEVLAMYQRQQGRLPYLPNYARAFCYRPGVMTAWAALQRAVRAELDDRAFGLITLAAAVAMGSSYCALAHAKKLVREFFSEEEMAAIVRDPGSSALPAGEQAMMALAAKVAQAPGAVTQQDIDTLRRHGFGDPQIFDIVAAAAARCFFARIPDALGISPDSAFAGMKPALRALLEVGRPIEHGDKATDHRLPGHTLDQDFSR